MLTIKNIQASCMKLDFLVAIAILIFSPSVEWILRNRTQNKIYLSLICEVAKLDLKDTDIVFISMGVLELFHMSIYSHSIEQLHWEQIYPVSCFFS